MLHLVLVYSVSGIGIETEIIYLNSCILQHFFPLDLIYYKITCVLESKATYLDHIYSNCYYKYMQTLAFQKKGSFVEEPYIPLKCWGQMVSTDFCAFGQNKNVLLGRVPLGSLLQLLRCFSFIAAFSISHFKRASLQRNNLLRAGFIKCVRSLNFFMLLMQKGYIHITGYWQSWHF